MACDRRVGFVFMTKLPGTSAEGMLSKRGEENYVIVLLFSSACCFREQSTNVQRLLLFARSVYAVCSSCIT